jgi:hypothetical protein
MKSEKSWTVQGCVAGRDTGGSAVTVLGEPICGVLGAVRICAKPHTAKLATAAQVSSCLKI